jgi:hypothetical protein
MLTEKMARDFLPFLQTTGGQVIRNHYDLITTAPPSANRCPQQYCVYDLAKAISRLTEIPFVPAFSQKQTRCTMTASPPALQPDYAMKPWLPLEIM